MGAQLSVHYTKSTAAQQEDERRLRFASVRRGGAAEEKTRVGGEEG